MSPYLDISQIKAQITMAHILSYYGISLRQINPEHLAGCCPIHKGDNPNAFHVDLKLNLFNCFSNCGGGSIFDFVMKMEQLDFYPAALKIWNAFFTHGKHQHKPHKPTHQKTNTSQNHKGVRGPVPVPVPQLKLQTDHPYLIKRHISPSTATYFKMGYCRWGMMKGRIAIPIIDCNRIVAYCGRAVNDRITPKYLFPKNFRKSNFIFNSQLIGYDDFRHPVFIVEGFFDCIRIVQAGLIAVALMGTSISSRQLRILKKTRRSFILMLDGDDAGNRATPIIEKKLKQWRISVRTQMLYGGIQPEQLGSDFLIFVADRGRNYK
jgi:DNA primase